MMSGRSRKEGTEIDVLGLIDQLEALVNAGTRVPLTSKALIDEQEFLELVDQIRVSLPDEVRHAKRVSQDRDRMMAQAQLEAEKAVTAAQERVEQLLDDSEIVRLATARADEIRRTLEEECRQMRADADAYAMDVLDGLESELNRLLASVRKGKVALETMSAEAEKAQVPDNGSRPARPAGKESNGL